MSSRVLVEGRPGSGKTTVAVRLADLIAGRGIEVRGFVTREMREAGRRVGFTVEAFGGKQATLAHVDFAGPPRVGRYGVDLEAFERVALPALASLPDRSIVVIDELGKMELASERFRAVVSGVLDAPIDVFATVHAFRHPFTDELKRAAGVERIRLTRDGRDTLPEELADKLSANR